MTASAERMTVAADAGSEVAEAPEDVGTIEQNYRASRRFHPMFRHHRAPKHKVQK